MKLHRPNPRTTTRPALRRRQHFLQGSAGSRQPALLAAFRPWTLLPMMAVPLLVSSALAEPSAASPQPPTVAGPRDTTSRTPTYHFRAQGAVVFRCAFDSTKLKSCPSRYSQRLEHGRHTLRVQAVGPTGARSRIVTVYVRVVPELEVGTSIAVGAGAGVPAIGAGSVWVPITSEGTLVRVDPVSESVDARITVSDSPSPQGDLDSATYADGSVWSASDVGGTIARVDPATNRVTDVLRVAARPGGLTTVGDEVWSFHFRQGVVTMIDAPTGVAREFSVPGLTATGITYGGGSVWLLGTHPDQVIRVNPKTGQVLQRMTLDPPFPLGSGIRRINTWGLAYGSGAVWASLWNFRAVARINAATGAVRYIRVPWGDPFAVAASEGSVWVASDRAVMKLDPGSGELLEASTAVRSGGFGFVSLASGGGDTWLSTYDPGLLSRVGG